MLMSPSEARGRPARPQLPAAHDEVVGNPHVQVELDVARTRLDGGAGARRLPPAWPLPAPGALAGARQRLPRCLLGAAGALGGAFGRNDLGQRLDAIRVVEQLQDAVDLEPAGRHPDVAFELWPRRARR